jgi:spermidine/putrescine transport system substrate-binding protein
MSLIVLAALLLATGSLALAQESTPEAASEYVPLTVDQITWECPEGFEGQSLNVYNWATYIGDNTIANFEALCDVSVTYDTYDSNESLVARLQQGNPGYDVAFPNDYIIPQMIREGLVQPIDLGRIPNFANILPEFLNPVFDPENEYTVPYLWGTTGIAYNVEAVGGEITSWTQLYDHDGPVAWLEDPRTMISVALLMLGYNPNSADPDEIAEARDFLIERGDNVVAIAADDGDALLVLGEVDIAVEYGGDIFQLIEDCECDDYAYAIPEEGSILDIATMVLLTDGPNPDLAHVFIDYILDPQVHADITNGTAYPTPNAAALEQGLIREDFLTNPAVTPDEEVRANMYFLEDIGDAQQDYQDAWDEVTILIGG